MNGRLAGAVAVTLALLVTAGPAAAGPAAAEVARPTPPPAVPVEPPAIRPPGPAAGLQPPRRCTPPAPQDGGDDPARSDPGSDPGSDSGSDHSGAARMRLPELRQLATGRGQLIAVIDTGVSPHPLLQGRLHGGGDYLAGGDGLDDCDGHGTAVAGLLAAAPDPGPDGRGTTPLGIAPDAQLLAIRQSSPSFAVPGPGGLRPAGDTDTLAAAIVLAVREGARVVNISEAVCLPAGRAAAVGGALQAALRLAADAQVVVVAAAGNVGSGSCVRAGPDQVSLPGWYDGDLLTVGAVGADDAAAPFTVPGPWVDVAAPGTGLRSLAVGGGTTTTGVDGTSFAAPWVAGLAALVRERFPQLTARQVADRILATARRPAGGRDDAVGYGVVDPVAALTAVPAVLDPDPPSPAGSAVLASTVARAKPGSPPWLLELAGATALLTAAALAACSLRRAPSTRRCRSDVSARR